MRHLTDHIINPANDKLTIAVTDEPGAGCANHRYEVRGFDASQNPSARPDDYAQVCVLTFQNGPIAEVGVNGLTHEVLLAVLMDRLRSFQTGPFVCRENDLALAKLEEALHWLQQRTISRMRRGVEGTHKR